MSADDILASVDEQVSLDASYLTLMGSSGVLAAVALLTSSVPLLIGSMVVAPALLPLELVAFATVRGRTDSLARGAKTAAAGMFVAVVAAVATTALLNLTGVLPPEANLIQKPLLEERVRPGWYSVIAAGAAGVSGALATEQHRTDTLVGVVASLALVPAAAAGGIALLSRDPTRAAGGFALLVVNAVLIVVTGAAAIAFHRWTRG